MKTKKVILFIVEGVTDKTSLGGIIDKLVSYILMVLVRKDNRHLADILSRSMVIKNYK